jgi:hypothetical protein
MTINEWCEHHGIKPEKIEKRHRVPVIGFCEESQMWYGWTFRNIRGYSIGYEVKQGNPIALDSGQNFFENPYLLPIGFEAKTLDDCRRMAMAFANSYSITY